MIGADELYPIYGFWHQPFWQTQEFYYAILCGIALVALVLLYFLFRYVKARKRAKKPWEIALAYLDELQKYVHTGERHDGKQFYLCITGLFKSYLYARYGFEVLGKTDEEMLAFLDQRGFDKDFITQLDEILRHGTLVKFANSDTIKSILEQDRMRSIALIKKTIPTEK